MSYTGIKLFRDNSSGVVYKFPVGLKEFPVYFSDPGGGAQVSFKFDNNWVTPQSYVDGDGEEALGSIYYRYLFNNIKYADLTT